MDSGWKEIDARNGVTEVKTVEEHINTLQGQVDDLSMQMDRIKKSIEYIDLILTDNAITDFEKKGLTMVKRYLEGEA